MAKTLTCVSMTRSSAQVLAREFSLSARLLTGGRALFLCFAVFRAMTGLSAGVAISYVSLIHIIVQRGVYIPALELAAANFTTVRLLCMAGNIWNHLLATIA